MRPLKVAARAELDLADIGNFIAADSPLNASRFVKRLRKNFALLAIRPFIGRARNELAPGLRSVAFGHYIIFYRISDDRLEIVRVVHGARDIKRVLSGS